MLRLTSTDSGSYSAPTCVKGMRSFINCCKIPDPSNGEGSVFSSKAGIWLVTARELYQMFVSNKPKFERCANTYILAIDELGTEETDFCEYGNRYKPIEQLLSYRYDKMLPTIITTNLPMADIRPKYGDRLAAAKPTETAASHLCAKARSNTNSR